MTLSKEKRRAASPWVAPEVAPAFPYEESRPGSGKPRPIRSKLLPKKPKKVIEKPVPSRPMGPPVARAAEVFEARGWKPFAFQEQCWQAYLEGKSGLVNAPTGTGKTLAVWLGPVIEALREAASTDKRSVKAGKGGTHVMWITPLRALASDTAKALADAAGAAGLAWNIALRTSDVGSSVKDAQRKSPPHAFVTTPESLSLLLSHEDARERFADLRCVIVDEWHELLGSKRGTLLELALARLRVWNPALRTWGVSATIGNLEEARDVLLGATKGELIRAEVEKVTIIESVVPETVERFPWAGHMGLRMLPEALALVEAATSALVFTNTRNQAETWYQAILAAKPEWENVIALHHGSLDSQVRTAVENGLKTGELRCVVCTSSLDLGVDFAPVDTVLQIGGPKGVARLLQRAGRSGHRPGRPSIIHCIPANALELVEFAAARESAEAGRLEPRLAPEAPLDVLVQHMVTVAIGGGFTPDELYDEVRAAWSYRALPREEFDWALTFVTTGGVALGAYPDYKKVVREEGSGRCVVTDRAIAMRHRMNVGTIVSDGTLSVQIVNGARLGNMDEVTLASVRPGDVFVFGGRTLELVRIRDMTAYVRASHGKGVRTLQWGGSRMPFSSELSDALREKMDEAARGVFVDKEMQALRPLFLLQNKWSRVPRTGELLVERLKTREGHHAFFHTYAGRVANEGLAALISLRLSRLEPRTFGVTVNDSGIELLCDRAFDLDATILRTLLTEDELDSDILVSVNTVELARRQFREVARIAGLVFTGFPGGKKSSRQVQVSSGLLFDVFSRYDPDNLLLVQSRREVMARQLDASRIRASVRAFTAGTIVVVPVERFTPLSFPLWATRALAHVSSEKIEDKLERMIESLEKAAGAPRI